MLHCRATHANGNSLAPGRLGATQYMGDRGAPGGWEGKDSACNAGALDWSLGQEDPLEKEMATHSSILAWRIPWTEELGGLQSTGSQRVGHDWVTNTHTHTHTHTLQRSICSSVGAEILCLESSERAGFLEKVAVERAFAGSQHEELRPWQRSWGRRLGIHKGGMEPQESPWKFSSIYPQNQSLPTLLLCALTYTSDFTGGCPPPPLSEKKLNYSSS